MWPLTSLLVAAPVLYELQQHSEACREKGYHQLSAAGL